MTTGRQYDRIDAQQALGRLCRQTPSRIEETTVVTSPGAGAAGWPAKIKSLYGYNVYNVRAVVLGEPGTLPVEIGQQMKAVNLAESFLESGTLPAETYVVILRVGDKNIFYA